MSESRYRYLRWLQVLLNPKNVIFRRASWDQQQVTAVDLEELTLLLGSTSHHCTEFLIVDSTIL